MKKKEGKGEMETGKEGKLKTVKAGKEERENRKTEKKGKGTGIKIDKGGNGSKTYY